MVLTPIFGSRQNRMTLDSVGILSCVLKFGMMRKQFGTSSLSGIPCQAELQPGLGSLDDGGDKIMVMFQSVTHVLASRPEIVVRCFFKGDSAPAIWEPEAVEAINRPGFEGECGQLEEVAQEQGPRILIVGLGARAEFTTAKFRKAVAKAGRRISTMRVSDVWFDFSPLDDLIQWGQTAGEVMGLLGWQMRAFKGAGSPSDTSVDLRIGSTNEEFDKGLVKGLALAESVNLARSLAATPPNVATPDWVAEQAASLEGLGLSVQVLRGDELERERMAGLINVGKASENKPCFIRVSYKPPQGSDRPPVVLLGKTITYDTGGLAIKSREGMKGMKGDKAGGCAVLGAMHAVATVVRPDFPVVGLLVAAENSISDNAFRMDDVLDFRNGVTVEVTNTDAEGRLVLADGLCWACAVEKPRCIVDLATLTGGVVVALGKVFAGLFANDEVLAEAIRSAGEDTGERVWRLPIDADYKDMLKSEVADIVNSAANRGAHPVMGAMFLSCFVDSAIPWAHVDIAGTAQAEGNKGPFVSGPTGFGVRLLARFLEGLDSVTGPE